jgi:hypothetical protein
MMMVKRAFSGLKVFRVEPQTGSITEVSVESAYKAGKPYYEARLLVRAPNEALWDIFAASAFRSRQDAERESARVQKGEP